MDCTCFGIYLHIPFCNSVCNYCDFNKTAKKDTTLKSSYFNSLKEHVKKWLELFPSQQFTSLYLGGGTPGLFDQEYVEVSTPILDKLTKDAEFTIEVNPDNITERKLQIWKSLKINRLSIGVQSFDDKFLKILTRDHSASTVVDKVKLAKNYFNNINLDLIYAIPTQTLNDFDKDLHILTDLDPTHISLYCLTYSDKTPLSRAKDKGLIYEASENTTYSFYKHAAQFLKSQNYTHEEISNWAKQDFLSQHNTLYWKALPYIGIGTAAHGFIPYGNDKIGLRYSYSTRLKDFCDLPIPNNLLKDNNKLLTFDNRNTTSWLYEYIGCGLRYHEGIDLSRIEKITGRTFTPTPIIKEAMSKGLIKLNPNNSQLTLTELEWFRETAWSVELISCF